MDLQPLRSPISEPLPFKEPPYPLHPSRQPLRLGPVDRPLPRQPLGPRLPQIRRNPPVPLRGPQVARPLIPRPSGVPRPVRVPIRLPPGRLPAVRSGPRVRLPFGRLLGWIGWGLLLYDLGRIIVPIVAPGSPLDRLLNGDPQPEYRPGLGNPVPGTEAGETYFVRIEIRRKLTEDGETTQISTYQAASVEGPVEISVQQRPDSNPGLFDVWVNQTSAIYAVYGVAAWLLIRVVANNPDADGPPDPVLPGGSSSNPPQPANPAGVDGEPVYPSPPTGVLPPSYPVPVFPPPGPTNLLPPYPAPSPLPPSRNPVVPQPDEYNPVPPPDAPTYPATDPNPDPDPDPDPDPGGGGGPPTEEDDCFQSPCHQALSSKLDEILQEIDIEPPECEVLSSLNLPLVRCTDGEPEIFFRRVRIADSDNTAVLHDYLSTTAALAMGATCADVDYDWTLVGDVALFGGNEFSTSPPFPVGSTAVRVELVSMPSGIRSYKIAGSEIQGRIAQIFLAYLIDGTEFYGPPLHQYFSAFLADFPSEGRPVRSIRISSYPGAIFRVWSWSPVSS